MSGAEFLDEGHVLKENLAEVQLGSQVALCSHVSLPRWPILVSLRIRKDWQLKQNDINLVLNRTDPVVKESEGSYRNAIQLEIAARCIANDSKYMMTLQQDIAICKSGWLRYLMSKINTKIKAAGVRLEKTRFADGVLHSLGCLFDFQLFRKYKLDFLPNLPQVDVGDKISLTFKENGYEIFATPNTLWDKEMISKIPDNSPVKELGVDRSFDDNNDVFFFHFVRGVIKSKSKRKSNNIEEWNKVIKKYFL